MSKLSDQQHILAYIKEKLSDQQHILAYIKEDVEQEFSKLI